jgi:hypothetical protein
MSYVVTLVQGTWAGKRKWTIEGWPLRRELEKQLGHIIEFRTLQWSGENWARENVSYLRYLRKLGSARRVLGQATYLRKFRKSETRPTRP